MAVSSPESGRSGRKRLEGELNLVPYIDLLTCMVAFLLITAVWTQLAQLSISQRGGGSDDGEPPQTRLVILVGEQGYNVVVGTERQVLPKRAGAYDLGALTAALAKVKAGLPDKIDALIASEDGIAFDTLVGTMDALLGAGFPGVSLVAATEAGL